MLNDKIDTQTAKQMCEAQLITTQRLTLGST